MRAPGGVVGPVRVLGRPEEHQHDELVLDVVEAVRDVCADEDRRAGAHDMLLIPDADRREPADHVVDLVLGVRTLRIRAAGRQHIETDGQVVGADELVIQPPGLALNAKEIGKLEGVHGSAA